MARPTRRGFFLLAAAVAAYLAARIVGTWELYVVAVTFAVAPLLAWALVTATSRRLDGARTVKPDRPTAGDTLWVAYRVRNRSALPGPQVTIPDAGGGLSFGDDELQFESLAPRGERVATAGPRPALRGVHRLPALLARVEDPLGLARANCRLGAPLELIVYPRLVHLASCALYPGMGAPHERGRRGPAVLGASEFRGVRPHNPGEPLSHIDWKATAKTGNLMLREMEDPASGDVTLLLDAPSSALVGRPADTNLEFAVQAAGSVADFVLRAGRGVTLMLPQDGWARTRLSPGTDGRQRLLRSLAAVAPHPGPRLGASLRTLLSHLTRSSPSRIVTVITLTLDSELVRAVVALREQGLPMSLINVAGTSFADHAPTPRGTDDEALLVALAAAGVRCLTLRRGDDLRSVLSPQRIDDRSTLVR